MYFEEGYGGVNYTRTSMFFFITIKRRIAYRAHKLCLNTDKVLSQGYDPVIVGIADPLTSI